MLGLILSLSFPVVGHAQEPVKSPSAAGEQGKYQESTDRKASLDHTFDEIVVTATRTATPLSSFEHQADLFAWGALRKEWGRCWAHAFP